MLNTVTNYDLLVQLTVSRWLIITTRFFLTRARHSSFNDFTPSLNCAHVVFVVSWGNRELLVRKKGEKNDDLKKKKEKYLGAKTAVWERAYRDQKCPRELWSCWSWRGERGLCRDDSGKIFVFVGQIFYLLVAAVPADDADVGSARRRARVQWRKWPSWRPRSRSNSCSSPSLRSSSGNWYPWVQRHCHRHHNPNQYHRITKNALPTVVSVSTLRYFFQKLPIQTFKEHAFFFFFSTSCFTPTPLMCQLFYHNSVIARMIFLSVF